MDYDRVVSICDAHGIRLPVDCIEMVVEIVRHDQPTDARRLDEHEFQRLFNKHGGPCGDEGWCINQSGLRDFLRELASHAAPVSAVGDTWIDDTIRELFGCCDGHDLSNLQVERAALARRMVELLASQTDAKAGEPDALCPETANLIVRFVEAMRQKLLKAQKKHGFTTEWLEPALKEAITADFHHYITKGDPLDVANYCAFMWHHGWSTADTLPAVALADDIRTVLEMFMTLYRIKGWEGDSAYMRAEKILAAHSAVGAVATTKGRLLRDPVRFDTVVPRDLSAGDLVFMIGGKPVLDQELARQEFLAATLKGV